MYTQGLPGTASTPCHDSVPSHFPRRPHRHVLRAATLTPGPHTSAAQRTVERVLLGSHNLAVLPAIHRPDDVRPLERFQQHLIVRPRKVYQAVPHTVGLRARRADDAVGIATQDAPRQLHERVAEVADEVAREWAAVQPIGLVGRNAARRENLQAAETIEEKRHLCRRLLAGCTTRTARGWKERRPGSTDRAEIGVSAECGASVVGRLWRCAYPADLVAAGAVQRVQGGQGICAEFEVSGQCRKEKDDNGVRAGDEVGE